MKHVLLALLIVVCFSSSASAKLTRIYVIVNMDNAPVEILEFGKWGRAEADEDRIASIAEYKNKTDRDIKALAITMMYYDAFEEKEDGVKGISTDLLKASEQNRSGWSIYGKPNFVKTAIAFVSAVRFLDGEVWRADIDEVIEAAGNMPGLSFLSEAKMLEIEKE